MYSIKNLLEQMESKTISRIKNTSKEYLFIRVFITNAFVKVTVRFSNNARKMYRDEIELDIYDARCIVSDWERYRA